MVALAYPTPSAGMIPEILAASVELVKGGDLAARSEEDARFALLLATAARSTSPWWDPISAEALVDATWMPLLRGDGHPSTAPTRYQVIQELVDALRGMRARWDTVHGALVRSVGGSSILRFDGGGSGGSAAGGGSLLAPRDDVGVALAAALLDLAVDLAAADDDDADDATDRECVLRVGERLVSATLDATPAAPAGLRRVLLDALLPAATRCAGALGREETARLTVARAARAMIAPDASAARRAAGWATLATPRGRDYALGPRGAAMTTTAAGGSGSNDDDDDALVDAIAAGLASDDVGERKGAMAALSHRVGDGGGDAHVSFVAMYSALEDYAAHLVEAAWAHLSALHPRAGDASSSSSPPPPPTPPVEYRYVQAAWTRGLRHPNPAVRASTLEAFCDREWSAARAGALTDAFTHEVLIPSAMALASGGRIGAKVAEVTRARVAAFSAAPDAFDAAARSLRAVADACARGLVTLAGIDAGARVVEAVAEAAEEAAARGVGVARRRPAETTDGCVSSLRVVAAAIAAKRQAHWQRRGVARVTRAATLIASVRSVGGAASLRAVRDFLAAMPSEPLTKPAAAAAAADGGEKDKGDVEDDARARVSRWVRSIAPSLIPDFFPTWKAFIDGPRSPHVVSMPRFVEPDVHEDAEKAAREIALMFSLLLGGGGADDDDDAASTLDLTPLTRAVYEGLFKHNEPPPGPDPTHPCGATTLLVDADHKTWRVERVHSLLKALFARSASTPDDARLADALREMLLFKHVESEETSYGTMRIVDVLPGLAVSATDTLLHPSYPVAMRRACGGVALLEAVCRWRRVGERRDVDATRGSPDAINWRLVINCATVPARRLPWRQIQNDENAVDVDDSVDVVARFESTFEALASSARGLNAVLRAGVVDDVAHAQTTELVNRALKGVAIALADHVKRLIERPANAFIDPDAKRAKADPDALRRAVASAVARAWTATHALLAIPLERKVTSTPEALRAERDELLDVTIPNALAVAVVDLERASATHALASLRVVGALLGYGRATEASAAATMRAIRAARGEAAPPTGPRLGDEFHLFVDTSDRNTSETAALGACVVRAAHAAVKSSKLRKNAPAWAAAVAAILHPRLFERDDLHLAHESPPDASAENVGAILWFVRRATAIANERGGSRVSRVVAHALCARLLGSPRFACAYAKELFALALAGDHGLTLVERAAVASRRRPGSGSGSDAPATAEDDAAALTRWLDDPASHVASRVAVLSLAHALARQRPPKGWRPSAYFENPKEYDHVKEGIDKDVPIKISESPQERYAWHARRAAEAILRVGLAAVSGGDADLCKETYRRGSLTHRRKIRAWQVLCAASPALGEPFTGTGGELGALLLAAAPKAVAHHNMPGVRYYAEVFFTRAAVAHPGVIDVVALPALRDPHVKAAAAASWIVVTASFVLRSPREMIERDAWHRRALVAITPWALAQNHMLRVFAQVAAHDVVEAFGAAAFGGVDVEKADAARAEGKINEPAGKKEEEEEEDDDPDWHLPETDAHPDGFIPKKDLLRALKQLGIKDEWLAQPWSRQYYKDEYTSEVDEREVDLLGAIHSVLKSRDEMVKVRAACGPLFTKDVAVDPASLLSGALDFENFEPEAGERENGGGGGGRDGGGDGDGDGDEPAPDQIGFEGAPASVLDKVDAFLKACRVELRRERDAVDAALWEDAMRNGHDCSTPVTGTGVLHPDGTVSGVDADAAAAAAAAAATTTTATATSTTSLQKKMEPLGRDVDDDAPTALDAFAAEMDASDVAAANAAAASAPRTRPPGLVVVASLLDRIPNLAGLARTCEVMGAEALVMRDKKATTRPEFTQISVTAEKHLPVREVPARRLASYLRALAREGYALIGLEQTRGAVALETFQFPKKTALVLGREREGVDADLLSLLDECVVIKQVGLIRSLNVHVSASIAIHAYAAQHA